MYLHCSTLVWPQWLSFVDKCQQGIDFSKKISKIKLIFDLTFTDPSHLGFQYQIFKQKLPKIWILRKIRSIELMVLKKSRFCLKNQLDEIKHSQELSIFSFIHIDCQFMLENGPNGVIMSPRFPQDYGNDWDCTWLIQVHPGQLITTNFLSFDIYSSGSTGYWWDSYPFLAPENWYLRNCNIFLSVYSISHYYYIFLQIEQL